MSKAKLLLNRLYGRLAQGPRPMPPTKDRHGHHLAAITFVNVSGTITRTQAIELARSLPLDIAIDEAIDTFMLDLAALIDPGFTGFHRWS